MDNPRPEKVATVAEVRGKLSGSQAALLADYRGLTVKDFSALRQSLAAVGATVGIYKNTLVRFAARDLAIDGLEPLLKGPTAITFVESDAAGAAKALRDFARTNPLLVVKGGLLGTKVVDAGAAKALADLPSRDVLLSQIAGLLQAPLQQMANLLEAVPRTFAYGLMALIDSKGGVPDEAVPDEAAPDEAAPEDTTATAAPEDAVSEAADTTTEPIPEPSDTASDAPPAATPDTQES